MLCLVLASLGLAACGGKSSNTNTTPDQPPVVSDAGTMLPPPDGQSGNPEDPPNINRTNQ
ncbi:MAG: hypothetical protein ABI678_11360 [Kofleriaceae bacterium]